MQQRAQRMRTTSGLPRWFWGSVCGFVLISVGIWLFYFLKPNDSNPLPYPEANISNENSPTETALQPDNAETLVTEINTDSTPSLTFPVGSVEEACGLLELPLYWDKFEDSDTDETLMPLLESEDCRTALAAHVGAINPYRWGPTNYDLQFDFFVLDNPLTFDRIFADPLGDFARVQDTQSWTECLSERGSTKNFEPKESCNADALMNYALFNRFCYYREIVVHAGQQFGEEQTREQSSFMWEQALEGSWVKMKCQEFDPDLKLSEHKHPDLTKLLASLGNPQSLELGLARLQSSRNPELSDPGETYPPSYLIYILIESAAILGDDAALLTNVPFAERGMRFGPFWGLLSNSAWSNLQKKREPSRERLRQTFELLPIFARSGFEIDWDRITRHLCEPPFKKSINPRSSQSNPEEPQESTESKSCRTVINELYVDGDLTDSESEFINRLERSALKLDLYH